VTLGALVGFLVSPTSIGSGSLLLPLLYLLLPRLGLRRLIGSDVVVAALLLPTAAVGRILLGSVDVRLTADLLVGALPGVVVGGKLLARFPDLVLRPALACALLWAGGNLQEFAKYSQHSCPTMPDRAALRMKTAARRRLSERSSTPSVAACLPTGYPAM
jgi:uncharacterized membrane protein YfcA